MSVNVLGQDGVVWSVCCVCWSCLRALEKWLNRPRCRLGAWIRWAQGTMY